MIGMHIPPILVSNLIVPGGGGGWSLVAVQKLLSSIQKNEKHILFEVPYFLTKIIKYHQQGLRLV
jgi:hypothetical protein